jgi:hypothetical protein
MNDANELDALIDASAALLGIAIAPDWRASIRQHLSISLGHAHAVMDFPLSDEADPAPVFTA